MDNCAGHTTVVDNNGLDNELLEDYLFIISAFAGVVAAISCIQLSITFVTIIQRQRVIEQVKREVFDLAHVLKGNSHTTNMLSALAMDSATTSRRYVPTSDLNVAQPRQVNEWTSPKKLNIDTTFERETTPSPTRARAPRHRRVATESILPDSPLPLSTMVEQHDRPSDSGQDIEERLAVLEKAQRVTLPDTRQRLTDPLDEYEPWKEERAPMQEYQPSETKAILASNWDSPLEIESMPVTSKPIRVMASPDGEMVEVTTDGLTTFLQHHVDLAEFGRWFVTDGEEGDIDEAQAEFVVQLLTRLKYDFDTTEEKWLTMGVLKRSLASAAAGGPGCGMDKLVPESTLTNRIASSKHTRTETETETETGTGTGTEITTA
jgi:hypothetical protein